MGTDAELALGVSLGRIDGRVTRDEALAHVRIIATATDCPVSADLEKGFGDAPADVAETVRLAAAAGVVKNLTNNSAGLLSLPTPSEKAVKD